MPIAVAAGTAEVMAQVAISWKLLIVWLQVFRLTTTGDVVSGVPLNDNVPVNVAPAATSSSKVTV